MTRTLVHRTFRGCLWLAAIASLSHAQSPETVALGRKLFFETRLSADGSISCATCHDPRRAFSGDRPLNPGVRGRVGNRHAPALIGRGWGTSQFWDGRAATLEEQVLEPIRNPNEMAGTVEGAIARLRSDAAAAALTPQSLAEALAAYVRTIRSEGSRYDRYLGGESGVYSDLEREGLRLFSDKARCYQCHAGRQLTDESFHNTGVAWNGRFTDEGRALVTGKPYHRGAFKTPTLREIASTAPYMHDGSIPTLEEAIEFYDRGGRPNPALDESIVPLRLSPEEKRALAAFLRTLSGTVREGP